jgi:trans-2,3-dihydro-3-hydroxyanthranilate isomerase
LKYRIVDVFTDVPLAGNALCVVTDPVSDESSMQAIAREVNLSETTFVTRTGEASYDVRIFTPGGELPFAGHPSLGTAWVMGPGRWTQRSPGATVTIEATGEGATMSAPDPTLTEVYPEDGARAVGLPEAAVAKAFVADVGGMGFLVLPTEAPIDGLRIDQSAVAAAAKAVGVPGVGIVRRLDDRTLHARVFVPGASIVEDPGTGSAAAPFGLIARKLWPSTSADLTIFQGAEIGRPCCIEVHAEVGNLRVGGRVAACAEGRFSWS